MSFLFGFFFFLLLLRVTVSQQELRCHAVLCTTGRQARQLTARLEQRLREALHDFRREKLCRQSARLSVAACLYEDYASAIPKRKLLLAPGINNYKYLTLISSVVVQLLFFFLLRGFSLFIYLYSSPATNLKASGGTV